MPFVLFILIAFFTAHISNRERPPVVYVDRLPPGGPQRGACLAPFCIVVRRGADSDVILRHELCHWAQYYALGFPGFYLTYLFQYLTQGYNAMPLEKACRFDEPPECRADYTSCYY